MERAYWQYKDFQYDKGVILGIHSSDPPPPPPFFKWGEVKRGSGGEEGGWNPLTDYGIYGMYVMEYMVYIFKLVKLPLK